MVGVQGFEPRQAESESAVLPLDDTPVQISTTAGMLVCFVVGQAGSAAESAGSAADPAAAEAEAVIGVVGDAGLAGAGAGLRFGEYHRGGAFIAGHGQNACSYGSAAMT